MLMFNKKLIGTSEMFKDVFLLIINGAGYLWALSSVFLFCLLYFIPSKVGANTGVELLSKCTSLKNQEADKS